HHRPVDALPSPRDSFHLVVLGQPSFPQRLEKARLFPLEKALMNGAGAAKALLGQGLPLAGSLCAAHTRWPRILGAPAWAADRRRACARRSCPQARHAEESAAPRAARTHPSPPTIRLAWPRSRSDTAHSAAQNDSLPNYG